MTTSHTQSNRILPLDAARFLAAVAVIWIHVCQTPGTSSLANVGRFAVPFFAATAAYLLVLSLQRKSELDLSSFVTSRLHRLYLPFIAWSGIYIAFKWSKSAVLHSNETFLPSWDIFILGGAYHLWFIPYLILASIATFIISKLVFASKSQATTVAMTCYFAGALLALTLTFTPESDNAIGYMAMATPAFFWGLSLGWLQTTNQLSKCNNGTMTSIAMTLGFGLLFLVSLFPASLFLPFSPERSPALENAAGVALLLAAIYAGHFMDSKYRPNGVANFISLLGKISLGVYFSHLIFVKVGEVLLERLASIGDLPAAATLFMLVTVAATTCSLIAYRHKLTRWLVA